MTLLLLALPNLMLCIFEQHPVLCSILKGQTGV